jgi:hypothetical protein
MNQKNVGRLVLPCTIRRWKLCRGGPFQCVHLVPSGASQNKNAEAERRQWTGFRSSVRVWKRRIRWPRYGGKGKVLRCTVYTRSVSRRGE